jgi:hypothetical protein
MGDSSTQLSREEATAQLKWMGHVRDRLDREAAPEVRAIAGPMREALHLGATSPTDDPDPDKAREAAEKMAYAGGLALFAMLTNLKKVRDAWSADAAAQAVGTPARAHLELAVSSMNHVLLTFGGAYNALRTGDPAPLQALPAQLDQLAAIEDQLRQSIQTIRPRKLADRPPQK